MIWLQGVSDYCRAAYIRKLLHFQLVRDILQKDFDSSVNSILVDFFLWDYRRDNAEEIESKGIPFHRVRCIYY